MDETPKKPRPKVFDPNYDRFKRSQKQEKRVADSFNGRRLPRSGGMGWSIWDGKASNRKHAKTAEGDIKTKDFLIEHKRTDRGSISIKKEWLDKVRDGARSAVRWPAMGLTFTDKQDRILEDWVAVPRNVFEQLLAQREKDG